MKYRVVVLVKREVEVTLDAEDEGAAVEAAIVIAKASKSAHDIVMCDVEAVVPGGEQSAA